MSTEMSKEQVNIILKKFKENIDNVEYRMWNNKINHLEMELKNSIIMIEYSHKHMEVGISDKKSRGCDTYFYKFSFEQFSPTYIKIRLMCRKLEKVKKRLDKKRKKESGKKHLQKLDEYLIETFPEELEKNLLE